MSVKSNDSYDYLFKIVVIGDSGVGKSNILSRYVKDTFSTDSKTTIGVEFASKQLTIKDKTIKIQIWDTAGQERFRSVSSYYYKGAVGALLCYDITRESTFENLSKWLSEMKEFAEPYACIMLVGNKSDLSEERVIKQDEAIAFAEKNNIAFLETSALLSTNIDLAFESLVNEIFTILNSESNPNNLMGSKISVENGSQIKLEAPQEPSKEKETTGCKC